MTSADEQHSAAGDRAQELRAEIHRLEGELGSLRTQLASLEATAAIQSRAATYTDRTPGNHPTAVDRHSPPTTKIALFRSLFVGRDDAYATRWTSAPTGKSGWSPAVHGGFYTDQTTDRDLLPLTDEVIEQHLRGTTTSGADFHTGLYPMLADDTCRLLVCDFDDGNWRADASAYAEACRHHRIPHAVEVSRSGEGAHVWIFLTERMPAALVRSLGASLLREAMSVRGGMALSSYDRFFPAQDLLPRRSTGRMRLGNLIALPLQGSCRKRGTTVFVDAETWLPHDDQFAFLSTLPPLSPDDVEERFTRLRGVRVGPMDTSLPLRRPPSKRPPKLSGSVLLRLAEQVSVPTEGLPVSVIAELKHAASIANPEFYRRQAQRFSTFGVPRFVACFEHDDDTLRLPRGLRDQASGVLTRAGLAVELAYEHPTPSPIDLAFHGELRPGQTEAVGRALESDTGVIAAEPGFGKTVIACAVIAARAVPTAITVNRAELADQWRDRLSRHLGIGADAIGQLGAGRRKRKGTVDIILLQSVSRRSTDPTILNEYGQIIVDECHAVGAPATEAALKQVNARYWLGLTATPYRADHMDGLITMQCGPIRFNRLTQVVPPAHDLIVHETSFSTDEPGDDGASIQAIYGEIADDAERNASIVADVTTAFNDGRHCLVLSNRIAHVEALADALRGSVAPVHVLHGRLSAQERAETRDALAEASESPFVLVAIDKIAGEGLDLPMLDTLFLTVPISFKGRVVQQLGRVTRTDGGAAVVHDYRDALVPLLERMHRKRRRIMEKQGFVVDE